MYKNKTEFQIYRIACDNYEGLIRSLSTMTSLSMIKKNHVENIKSVHFKVLENQIISIIIEFQPPQIIEFCDHDVIKIEISV